MSAYWLLPLSLLAMAFVALAYAARAKDQTASRRASALAGVLTMSSIVVGQLHAHVRVESEIREEVAALSEPQPHPRDAQAYTVMRSIQQSRLKEIVREAQGMEPWLLVLASTVLGMSLARLLEVGRKLPGEGQTQ